MNKNLTSATRYDCIVNPSRTTAYQVMSESAEGDWVRSSDYERDVQAAFEAGKKHAAKKAAQMAADAPARRSAQPRR